MSDGGAPPLLFTAVAAEVASCFVLSATAAAMGDEVRELLVDLELLGRGCNGIDPRPACGERRGKPGASCLDLSFDAASSVVSFVSASDFNLAALAASARARAATAFSFAAATFRACTAAASSFTSPLSSLNAGRSGGVSRGG